MIKFAKLQQLIFLYGRKNVPKSIQIDSGTGMLFGNCRQQPDKE